LNDARKGKKRGKKSFNGIKKENGTSLFGVGDEIFFLPLCLCASVV
jgi:hypothetical protein